MIETTKMYHRDEHANGETWCHFWTFLADAESEWTDEDLVNWGRNCLREVEQHDCLDAGSGSPGCVFHHAPYRYFSGMEPEPGYTRAVCVVAQRGGYDI